MNTVHVRVDVHHDNHNHTDDSHAVMVPVVVPDLAAVHGLADRLHTEGREYSGIVWGWPVQYDPELREEAAEFQIPDGEGGYRTEIRPFWSPASFTIGENGVWFYSLLWEYGSDQAPVEFLDDQNVLVQVEHHLEEHSMS